MDGKQLTIRSHRNGCKALNERVPDWMRLTKRVVDEEAEGRIRRSVGGVIRRQEGMNRRISL